MRDYIRYFDKITFLTLISICFAGIVLIYSASSGNMGYSLSIKQGIWLVFSVIMFFIAFSFKTDFIMRMSGPVLVIFVIALFAQLVFGKIMAGTKSWISLGFINIQVSEFIKIPLGLTIARFLAKVSFFHWNNFIRLLMIFAPAFILIGLQPDMGTAFILTSFIIVAVIMKGVQRSIIVIALISLILVSYVGWNYILKDYQKSRITSFMNPEKYRKSSGYQIIQSKIAIGSGGLVGKGYLKGSQSQYRFLPTRHTDFIASVLGEEFGFLGISFLFLLYFTFFYRQFRIKPKSDEEFYFVYLFNSIIIFQFLINILMAIGFVPILGVPLPFVSYGGSSMLAFFIGQGFVFRMRINSYINEY